MITLCLPHPDFQKQLLSEVVWAQSHKLVGPTQFQGQTWVALDIQSYIPVWAQQVWRGCQVINFESVRDAASKIKSPGTFWHNSSEQWHRRGELILEHLARFRSDPLKWQKNPLTLPQKNLGQFLLLSENQLIFSDQVFPKWPDGIIRFVEDSKPPSRAYMKLWEALLVEQINLPQSGTCLELGASPGGWTYVLKDHFSKLICVDKAPLSTQLEWPKKIEFLKADAFKLNPDDFDSIDWLFSDMICPPESLLEQVKKWHASGKVKNFLCTIKFQGQTDFEIVQKFLEIPNTRCRHLFNNKHEVTWLCTQNDRGFLSVQS